MQGITGFACTILAMPFSLMLVGYPVAKPVLNVLGLLSGVYVFLEQKKQVQWKEVRTIVLIMAAGIFLGIYIKGLFAGREQFLIRALGVFVIILGLQGLIGRIRGKKNPMRPDHMGYHREHAPLHVPAQHVRVQDMNVRVTSNVLQNLVFWG
jgi:uncharacterized membrane protein YfcA